MSNVTASADPSSTVDEAARAQAPDVDVRFSDAERELLSRAFWRSPVATALIVDDEARGLIVSAANPALGKLLGAEVEGLIGRGLTRFRVPGDAEALISPAALRGELASDRVERELRRTDGTHVAVALTTEVISTPGQTPAVLLAVLEDITARHRVEAALAEQVLTDPLTGLPNRIALRDRVSVALSRLDRSPTHLAVMTIDVDAFTGINDAFGQVVGDVTLAGLAERFTNVIRIPDTVARTGGDEFVVVVEGLPVPGEAMKLADRLQRSVMRPLNVEGIEVPIALSIGVAVTDDAAIGVDTILRQSELALESAKSGDRGRVQLFEGTPSAIASHKLSAVETVRHALREDRVIVYYQPIMDLLTGELSGCEALVRIRTTDGQILSPATFLEAAEQSGLLYAVDERVLSIALAQDTVWREAGLRLRMSINVSPRRLGAPGFADHVAALLGVHDVEASDICLEVTETSVVDLGGPTRVAIEALRETGVHVAIDDFGTGWSGLTSLRRLDADIVKIDRSFVSGLGKEAPDTAIVSGVIDMAHRLGRKVVAEGVETVEQAQRLRELECDYAQGFLVSRPVSSDDFIAAAAGFADALKGRGPAGDSGATSAATPPRRAGIWRR